MSNGSRRTWQSVLDRYDKPDGLGKPLWHSKGPTHNSTHIRPGRVSNQGHLGERRALDAQANHATQGKQLKLRKMIGNVCKASYSVTQGASKAKKLMIDLYHGACSHLEFLPLKSMFPNGGWKNKIVWFLFAKWVLAFTPLHWTDLKPLSNPTYLNPSIKPVQFQLFLPT